MYDPDNDVVTLDGPNPGRQWPVGIAEELLGDPTPWSVGYGGATPDQHRKFAEVASFVNGFNRGSLSPKVAVQRLRHPEALGNYSTQHLLDMLSVVWRMERHVGGGLVDIEAGLRESLRVVVTRIRSSTPPRFLFP